MLNCRYDVNIIKFCLVVSLLLLLLDSSADAQQQDPMSLNGGNVLAMAGKSCVALAVDKRFGMGNKLINVYPRPILILPTKKHTSFLSAREYDSNQLNACSSIVVAFTGLEGDIQSFMSELSAQVQNKIHRGLGFMASESTLTPNAVSSLTSHLLYYRKRSPFYVEPIIVGIDLVEEDDNVDEKSSNRKSSLENTMMKKDGKVQVQSKMIFRPYLCTMDIIGAKSQSSSFVCAGVASKSLYGTAEAYWKPNMNEDELVEVCAKAFLSALERDCLSGYGATIYLISSDGSITEYDLECRND